MTRNIPPIGILPRGNNKKHGKQFMYKDVCKSIMYHRGKKNPPIYMSKPN